VLQPVASATLVSKRYHKHCPLAQRPNREVFGLSGWKAGKTLFDTASKYLAVLKMAQIDYRKGEIMNELPWVAEARKHIGIKEIKGSGIHPHYWPAALTAENKPDPKLPLAGRFVLPLLQRDYNVSTKY
jgi:hypothetical protein